ncbi:MULTISPECIES: LacI family DNA-binding transcriptional regulator [unclassified Oceanispirochaeta]|uniref:LacI family DNA-binding transcriptional regulator n=1 Tax=unclassified Oceanispirochaeta TaxID=2635722 RepID=UPI000E0978D1|nr:MULTISPECIES: LacI family DNA-binding transcriptional regulator [unclassified Oceanispirochaeta]MBF9018378.1 LacI family DNA-binding transcriptional regulator [Oceanispirochaeta sp. M2]NPD74818.1 LacI family transcriptional regulator [Oceanispirochaeta sp. M1]RDG29311.1 LacI family transcriptional regulator [Oceanispirochaeta sp. M1]
MDRQKRITIIEIAKMAKVSKATVSKTLNNKPGVGDDTRERIMEIVDQLDFQPDSAARALSNQKTSNIGLVIPHEAGRSLNNDYWSAMISAIADEAAAMEYNLMLFTPREEGALENLYKSIINSNKVDGLIIGSEIIDKDQMSLLDQTDIPFILIGQNPDFKHHFVDIDNAYAGKSITEYMINRGYRNIAFISGPENYYYNRQRTISFRETMFNHGLHPCNAAADEFNTQSIYSAVDKVLTDCPDLDGLFIGAGGNFLYDVLERLEQKNISAASIGVTVFDDYRYLNFMEPKLTAIRQPTSLLGREAVKSLFRLISSENNSSKNNIFKTTITERSSCPVIQR